MLTCPIGSRILNTFRINSSDCFGHCISKSARRTCVPKSVCIMHGLSETHKLYCSVLGSVMKNSCSRFLVGEPIQISYQLSNTSGANCGSLSNLHWLSSICVLNLM